MTSSRDLADDVAQRLQISNSGPCSLETMTREVGLAWLNQLDVRILDPGRLSDEDIREKVRYALWDSQRIDCLFHGSTYKDGRPLDVEKFSSWPKWKERTDLKKLDTGGLAHLDAYKDAKRLDSYLSRHFTSTIYSQIQLHDGQVWNPADALPGAWSGTKMIMGNVSAMLAAEGYKDRPFSIYITSEGGGCLLIEYIDVKQCPWPDPSDKLLRMMRCTQQSKFGQPKDAPLVPMMDTPKFPLLLVRYKYFEREPAEGAKFLVHLIKKNMKSTAPHAIAKKLKARLDNAEQVDEEHTRMLVRVLSYNSTLLSPDYVKDLQSHWNVPQEIADDTKISFLVPCLRLRFRVLEEIETGNQTTIPRFCRACEKPAEKMCASCQSVYYCNPDCSKSDWPKHKLVCKFSKRLFDPDCDLPTDKFYVPTRSYHDFVIENHFAVEQEAILVSGLSPEGDCPPNEYGDEPFILRVIVSLDYAVNGTFKGQTARMWDRRRSLQLRSGPGESPFALSIGEPPVPFHAKGHATLMRLVRSFGIERQLVYLYARRIGDCLEVDLTRPAKPDYLW